jgi:hypothetical protein
MESELPDEATARNLEAAAEKHRGQMGRAECGCQITCSCVYPLSERGHVNTKWNLPKHLTVKGKEPQRVWSKASRILDLRTRLEVDHRFRFAVSLHTGRNLFGCLDKKIPYHPASKKVKLLLF